MSDWNRDAGGRAMGWPVLAAALLSAALSCPGAAQAQLRIVTYNTSGAPRSGMNIVLESIGEESRSGIAKPIDVLLLQEQSTSSGLPNTQAFVDLLNNSIYAGQTFDGQPITYARGTLIGSGDTTQSIVYRTQTVQLLGQATVGTASSSGQPRQALRYKLKPAGYDDSAAFYIYNSHYKASQDSSGSTENADRRNVEATAIRANSDALGQGISAIYAGDHNFYDYTQADEPAFQTLIAAGNGQAFDPVDRIGTWHNNSAFRDVHTQSPTTTAHYSGQVVGGLDDRFDFQLVTGELLDGEGLDYISGSYHTFGNNGSLPCCNADINDAGNTVTFPGVTSYTKSQILNALNTIADHLPVVADYQLPAVLSALVSSVPTTLHVGDIFNLDVTVSNAANVLQPIGADELDYSVTTSGNLFGSFFNQLDMALGGGNLHQILLDTSTPGLKSGTIFVQSGSPAVQNGQLQFPISFEVLAATLAGDFNSDGTVDAADYVVWRDGFGTTYNQDDYQVWSDHFGQSLGGGAGAVGVPEPRAAALVLAAVCWLAWRPGTLRAWNRLG